MYTRRQFCGVLGGTILGGAMVEAVCANFPSVTGEEITPVQMSHGFSASKIHLERWFGELRHQSRQARLEELRKRFSPIRARSEAVLFIPGEGIPSVFQDDLVHEAKKTGLSVFLSPENVDFARSALGEIQAGSSEFTTLAFPLEEVGDRIQILTPSPSQTVRGYFYTRFFRPSAVSLPLAIILFEVSRCLWETYIFRDLLQNFSWARGSYKSQTVPRDCVDNGYARLIDQTRVGSINHIQEKELS